VRASYDAVAAAYADRFTNELDGKPLDRALLDEVAARAGGAICDLGCGPGHVAGHLHHATPDVVGIDLSPGMIEEARRRHPDVRFEVADMRSLPHVDGAFAAVVALYSLIHLDDRGLATALREVRRVLRPGGLLLAGLHRGAGSVHVDDMLGAPVDLDFRFFEPEQITAALRDAGFDVERVVERDAYPGVEAETRRFYALAVSAARGR
jgi:ubiquinone/menaquinone biosynthesis C-methylase UbiE